MAQTIISGLRDTTTAQGTQLIPPQIVQNKIDLLTANDAPWTLITRAAKKHKPVGNWSYLITQDLLLKRSTTLASAVAVGATTWNLATDTGDYVSGWDILWNRTRNVFVHVQSVSTDAVTVVANIDSGTDTAGVAGDEVWIISNATQEAGGMVESLTTQETQRTNYQTDIMTALDYSDMAMFSDYFFEGKDIDFQRMKSAIEHQRKLERALKLGPKATLLTPSGTYENPTRNGSYRAGLTMSFRAFMSAYADSSHLLTDTDLTEAEFIDNTEPAFYAEDEGANKKKVLLWLPPRLATGMTKWNIGRGKFESKTSSKKATLGLKFTRWDSPFGPIDLVIDHELQSTVSGGEHMYFFVDVGRIGYVPYKNLDTHMVELPQTISNPKRQVVYWRTVMGSHYTQENAHVYGKFVTTSA